MGITHGSFVENFKTHKQRKNIKAQSGSLDGKSYILICGILVYRYIMNTEYYILIYKYILIYIVIYLYNKDHTENLREVKQSAFFFAVAEELFRIQKILIFKN